MYCRVRCAPLIACAWFSAIAPLCAMGVRSAFFSEMCAVVVMNPLVQCELMCNVEFKVHGLVQCAPLSSMNRRVQYECDVHSRVRFAWFSAMCTVKCDEPLSAMRVQFQPLSAFCTVECNVHGLVQCAWFSEMNR